jgi:hypothetical protein
MVLTREQWQEKAEEYIRIRLGVAGAQENEFMVGYIDDFIGVYAIPEQIEGEPWFVWFLFPEGKAAGVVNELIPGVYYDHEGHVIEHDPEWTLVLGTNTRRGRGLLLTRDLFK